MNIKKFFGFQSIQDKVEEYKELLQKSYNINSSLNTKTEEFFEKSQSLKNLGDLSESEKQDVMRRHTEFLNEHTDSIDELKKSYEKIEKAIAKLESDEEFAELAGDVKDLLKAKFSYKSKKISKSIYNDIIKAKTKKIKYADVLLFRGSKMLILQRAGEYGSNSTEWCIPGGHVDVGEDFRQAAARELFEETGIEVPEDLLTEVAVATGKDFEIHYFMGSIDSEAPASVVVDSEEEIGSAWIEPATEIDDYEFIFDMKDNVKRILGLEPTRIQLMQIAKAYSEGKISKKIFEDYCKKHPEEIEKSKNKTYFSHKERKDLAKKGEAMPNGKYPIRNSQDLKDAIRLVGASDMPEAEVKAWIKKRAKALGLENELPEDWKEKVMDCNDAQAICKEDLDKKLEGPQGDGINKSIDFSQKIDESNLVKKEDVGKYYYNRGSFYCNDRTDGHCCNAFFDFLGTLEKAANLDEELHITLSVKDRGEQSWHLEKSFNISEIQKVENIHKSEENELSNDTEGFNLSINFNDLDQAEMFKSFVSEMAKDQTLDIASISEQYESVEKSKDPFYGIFLDFANFLEGAKTRSKNVHWGETDNSKHVYLDEMLEEMSDFEDKLMEAGQSGFGRFKDGEVKGEELDINDPIELVDEIIERTQKFYKEIEGEEDFVGEKSWVEDFLATLKQTKYRLQLH